MKANIRKSSIWTIASTMVLVFSLNISMIQHSEAQEDFFGEDSFEEFVDEEGAFDSETPSATANTKEKKQDEFSEDFSDEDFSADEQNLSFDDFGGESNAEPSGEFVNEGFDESLPAASSDDFELEPLDGSEPPIEDAFPSFEEFAGEEPVQEPTVEPIVEEPIIATPEPAFEPEPVAEEPGVEEPVVEAAPVFEPAPTDIVDSTQFYDEEPDHQYEAKLHDIYLNFHSKSIPEDQWSLMVGDRQSEVYAIQSGDNLWNISSTLFNDGNYWPKIWSLNRDIKNPHVINPGDRLRFVMGTEADAPSFTVGQAVPSSGPPTLMDTPSTPAREIEIPPPLVPVRPILGKLPPSFPEWQADPPGSKYDELGIEIVPRKVTKIKSEIYLPSYVEDEDVKPVGRLVEVEGYENTATDNQYVYVRIEKGMAREGDRLLVTEANGKIRVDNNIVKEESLGVEISVLGSIKLQSQVASRVPSETHDLYRAFVEKSISNLRVGSEVRVGSLRKIPMSLEGPRSLVVAQITGGSYDTERNLFADQNIVYLSRGANDGLMEGQILQVRANVQLRNRDTLVADNVRPTGFLRVVRVSPKYATAVVVKAWDDIQTGDFTGEGQLLSSASDFLPQNELGESGETSVEVIPAEEEELYEYEDSPFDPAE